MLISGSLWFSIDENTRKAQMKKENGMLCILPLSEDPFIKVFTYLEFFFFSENSSA